MANWTRAHPACAAEAARRIAGAQLHIVEGAGHWDQREKPEEVTRLVREFVMD